VLIAYSANESRSLGDYIVHDAGLYMNGGKSLNVNAKSKKDAKVTFRPDNSSLCLGDYSCSGLLAFQVDPHLIIHASPLDSSLGRFIRY
jgi:hypothetical protein